MTLLVSAAEQIDLLSRLPIDILTKYFFAVTMDGSVYQEISVTCASEKRHQPTSSRQIARYTW